MSTTLSTSETRLVAKRLGFRPDIEGLRAIAVLSVLVYHLRSAYLPGGFVGVDIFFVISGFLITSHLVGEHEKTGRISLPRFYARRMVRLIPAATLALLGTVVATVLFVPRILWQQVGVDVMASAAYVNNWVLAGRSVDYLAEDSIVSPVQHFWSLAVEEQYYLIWPLLIIGAGLLAVRLGARTRLVMAITGVVVIVLSLGTAIVAQLSGDVTAYFATTTRLWELAVGAVTAIGLGWLRHRIGPTALRVLFYAGLAGVLASVVLIGDQTEWPGGWTLLPVLATALVLLSGGVHERPTWAERALSIRPLVWVGGISYSLYLWHWPMIVIAGYVFGEMGLPLLAAIAIASVLAAWLSGKLVENPIRFSRWAKARSRNGLVLGLGLGAVSVAAGAALVFAAPSGALQAPEGVRAAGATALTSPLSSVTVETLEAQPDWVSPSPLEATSDVPELYGDGCQQDQQSSDVLECTYGDETSSKVIALVGDSKAGQWLPALDEIGEQIGYRVVTMTKSACAFSSAPSVIDGGRYDSCDDWNEKALLRLDELDPAVVVTSTVQDSAWTDDGRDARTPEGVAAMADGIADSLREVRAGGADVVVLADTPAPPRPVYECVGEHPDDVDQCEFPLAPAAEKSALQTQLTAVGELGASSIDAEGALTTGADPDTVFVDLTDAICPPQVSDGCPPVIGNALIYRQGSHITATYAETLAPDLHELLVTAGVLPDTAG